MTSTDKNTQYFSFSLNVIGNSNDARYYGDLPAPIQNGLDQIARGLFDPESNCVIVTGSKSSGKSLLIEEFAANVQEYLPHSQVDMLYLIKLAPKDQATISRIPGGSQAFLRSASNELKCDVDNICVVTENPDFAVFLQTTLPETKIILETNYITYLNMIGHENRGASKVWGSWNMVDLDRIAFTREEAKESLNLIIAPRLITTHKIDLSEPVVGAFVDEIFDNYPELNYTDDDSVSDELIGKSCLSPGLWGRALRRLASNLAFSFKKEFYDLEAGEKDVNRIIQATAVEVADECEEIFEEQHLARMASDMPSGMEGMIHVMGGMFDQEQEEDPTPPAKIEFVDSTVLRPGLESEVFGQGQAIDTLVDSMTVVSAGLVDENKPLRVLLFAGPTGVGKTQLAFSLAKYAATTPMNVIRIDMSEYSEPQEVSKLFGAAPGYIGYDRGGILTSKVRKQPNSLIILDEIEKAHPQIWDSFLQVFDSGRLTDNKGRLVDFTKTIIIMTSNLGVKDLATSNVGFSQYELPPEIYHKKIGEAIERAFKAEFMNRIDEIVLFNHLTLDVARNVVRREIGIIEDRMRSKGFSFNVYDDELVDNIIGRSQFNKYGAREIQRVVFNNVSKPVAAKMMTKANSKRKKIKLALADNKIKVS